MRLSKRHLDGILGEQVKPDPVMTRVDSLETAIHEVRDVITMSMANIPATYDDRVLIGRIAAMERAVEGISQIPKPQPYNDGNVLARIERLEKILLSMERPKEWNFEIVRDSGGDMTKIIGKAAEAKATNRRKD